MVESKFVVGDMPHDEEYATEAWELNFTREQAEQLELAANEVAKLGGPQSKGVKLQAERWGEKIAKTLSEKQAYVVHRFLKEELPLIIFKNMINSTGDDTPTELPPLSELEQDFHCLCLASRSQILLHVIKHRAFAYDLDNLGKITRLVGNFTGGGMCKINGETKETVELSSHSGLALGAHFIRQWGLVFG